MNQNKLRGFAIFFAMFLAIMGAIGTSRLWAQTTASESEMPPAVIDEDELFGGPKDIVTVIDPNVASAGTVQLVEDTKKYPVFLIDGTAGAGLYGSYTLMNSSSTSNSSTSEKEALYGAVNISGLSFDYLPVKNLHFSVTNDLLAVPNEILAASISAYADLRQSDLVRLYIAGSLNYDPYTYLSTSIYSSAVTTPTVSLDEAFLDTEINQTVFFRLGKQRISWGVGNWYKPSDMLSLSAIDPDDPTAAREGPFAFKVDIPMKLNHLMVYMVPPVSTDAASSSIASKYDLIVNGWELSFGAYGRADMLARPRGIFMFTGALGAFDVYGENVLSYGSDRIYVKESSSTPGTYETYQMLNSPFFQSTLGIKYSKSYSTGLSYAFQVQGYYNGMGYADSSILQNSAARAAIKNSVQYEEFLRTNSVRTAQAGRWYLAGSASVSGRFGEGNSLTQVTGSLYVLTNFSDGSVRINPQLKVSMGDEGAKVSFTLSDLTAFGLAGSEYAPNGTTTTPAFTASIFNGTVALQASVPITLATDYSVQKVQTKFSIYWNAVQY